MSKSDRKTPTDAPKRFLTVSYRNTTGISAKKIGPKNGPEVARLGIYDFGISKAFGNTAPPGGFDEGTESLADRKPEEGSGGFTQPLETLSNLLLAAIFFQFRFRDTCEVEMEGK